MRRNFLKYIGLAMLAMPVHFTALAATPSAPAAGEPVKVVYHLSEGLDQAAQAMANIRNHLRADPDVRIVVVALGEGIRFLLQDAQDRNGKAFAPQVAALAAQGVDFRVCNNTLTAHGISPDRLLPQAKIVPSGVAEVARLQAREGFAYLRP